MWMRLVGYQGWVVVKGWICGIDALDSSRSLGMTVIKRLWMTQQTCLEMT